MVIIKVEHISIHEKSCDIKTIGYFNVLSTAQEATDILKHTKGFCDQPFNFIFTRFILNTNKKISEIFEASLTLHDIDYSIEEVLYIKIFPSLKSAERALSNYIQLNHSMLRETNLNVEGNVSKYVLNQIYWGDGFM